jgi:adenylosuccinate lyase
VEIAATEANCRLGRVPEEALETIKNKAVLFRRAAFWKLRQKSVTT